MTCNKCLHFQMDAEPGHHRIGAKYIYCYLHRCVFDRGQMNADKAACGRFVDRAKHEAEENRKRYGFDKPVERTDVARQETLL